MTASTAPDETRIALVTGGGTGIGFACAAALAGQGWTVTIAGRRAEILDGAARELRARHSSAKVISHQADVGDPRQISELVDAVIAAHGQLDAVICAAAIYEAVPVAELGAEDWDPVVNVVLRGTALTAAAAARYMSERGQGRIVLISSINSDVSEFEQAPYSAAKAGVSSLARSMAVELSEAGVSVNAVSPGWVRTPMTEEGIDDISADTWRRISPIARPGEPEEIANLVTYLVAEAPPFLTGTSIVIDGGQTAMAAMP